MSIEGLDKLFRQLDKLTQDSLISNALSIEGAKVRDEAKLLCPVDTGNLRNSIRCSEPKKDSKGNWSIEIYTNSEYATYVEFGTGKRGQATNTNSDVAVTYREDGWCYQDKDGNWWYTEGQPAQPFLYPALKNNEAKIVINMAKNIEQQIRRL